MESIEGIGGTSVTRMLRRVVDFKPDNSGYQAVYVEPNGDTNTTIKTVPIVGWLSVEIWPDYGSDDNIEYVERVEEIVPAVIQGVTVVDATRNPFLHGIKHPGMSYETRFDQRLEFVRAVRAKSRDDE